MVAKIIPGFYAQETRQVSRPSPKRYPFFTGRPMGLFLSQPVRLYGSIEDVRGFLTGCRYMTDQEQFGVRDHWMPPEDFEQARQGDCDDFALWTWRQLVQLGYRARFVYGLCGRYGGGHAWVTFEADGEWYLVEPLLARAGRTIPRILVLYYQPRISVEAFGKHVKFFEHIHSATSPAFASVAPLVPEVTVFYLRSAWTWARWGARHCVRLPRTVIRLVKRRG